MAFTPRTRMKSGTNAPPEIFLVNWLAKIADDSVRESAGPINFIGVGSNEDCRNRVAHVDEVSIEFEPGHRRHMDVGDQAGCLAEMRGCEEIRCRREDFYTIAERPHEPSHGIAK
jgi:hypothetical protein